MWGGLIRCICKPDKNGPFLYPSNKKRGKRKEKRTSTRSFWPMKQFLKLWTLSPSVSSESNTSSFLCEISHSVRRFQLQSFLFLAKFKSRFLCCFDKLSRTFLVFWLNFKSHYFSCILVFSCEPNIDVFECKI